MGAVRLWVQVFKGEKHTVGRFPPLLAVGSLVHLPFLAVHMLLPAAAGRLGGAWCLDVAGVGIHGHTAANVGDPLFFPVVGGDCGGSRGRQPAVRRSVRCGGGSCDRSVALGPGHDSRAAGQGNGCVELGGRRDSLQGRLLLVVLLLLVVVGLRGDDDEAIVIRGGDDGGRL